MTDYFALLGEPRQTWLDEEALKSKFFALSSTVHPDRAHSLPEREKQAAQERYTQLNAAYQCLREPKDRLRHLLELETGRKVTQVTDVPDDLVDLFFQVGRICREADELTTRYAAVASPMLLVQRLAQKEAVNERVIKLRENLTERQQRLFDELKELNPTWRQQLQRLEQIQQTLSYLAKWTSQLQGRFVKFASW